uniref:Uncharacterized protein n=1 Tax=Pyxicephalus adspersus TaxID=30357 RepID=A0AAV3AGB2_PYXAD|nr:TPA: hypothetical protein GDO54_010566 [Pyxicephalus adspersus]
MVLLPSADTLLLCVVISTELFVIADTKLLLKLENEPDVMLFEADIPDIFPVVVTFTRDIKRLLFVVKPRVEGTLGNGVESLPVLLDVFPNGDILVEGAVKEIACTDMVELLLVFGVLLLTVGIPVVLIFEKNAV